MKRLILAALSVLTFVGLNVAQAGALQAQAVKLMDRAGYR